jgi:hypothetical protein
MRRRAADATAFPPSKMWIGVSSQFCESAVRRMSVRASLAPNRTPAIWVFEDI